MVNEFAKPLGYAYLSDTKELLTYGNADDGYTVLRVKGGSTIVPYGKYDSIDGFAKGYARVNIEQNINGAKVKKWGIINEQGKLVAPLEYDDIEEFYRDRNKGTIVLTKAGEPSKVFEFKTGNISLSSSSEETKRMKKP